MNIGEFVAGLALIVLGVVAWLGRRHFADLTTVPPPISMVGGGVAIACGIALAIWTVLTGG